MQTSRIIRTVALILFFLFPLLSVVQLRDTDAPWRRVAEGLRPSVVLLQNAAGVEFGCGLILQDRPLRVVTVGVPPEGMRSAHGNSTLSWSPILVDEERRFTILQAVGDASLALGAAPRGTLLDVAGASMRTDGVKAALVGPRQIDGESLWVGVLQPTVLQGEPLYRASLMRRIDAVASVPTSDAWALGDERIDMRLRGAPFADADGNVIGLYRTHQGHHEDVLPIHVVCRSLVFLHLQAAQSFR